ncbi:MAG: hypothetical protein GEU81_00360 [Nitriliruptorales bacterium]|nr:hypothetical protein [Nitriliruptorales bacterium]
MAVAGAPRPRSRRRGRVGLPLVAALVLAAAVLIVQAWWAARGVSLPTGPGYTVDLTVAPYGQRIEETPGAVIELVMLGDSTVAGVGSPTAAESLPALVAQRVADRLGRAVHVVGYGVSGACTDVVRAEQVPLMLDTGVDVVVIVVGSNDVSHLTPVWNMRSRTQDLLEAARSQSGAPVVLGGIPQFRTVPRLQQPLRFVTGVYANALREPQRAAAASDLPVRYVDIAAEASPRFVGRPESMSADGYHPSPMGYGFWADALAPAVAAAASDSTAGVAS